MKKEIDVAAALMKENDKFLLCQRKKGDRYGLLWEFPGGVIEERESPQEAIKREIKEELGVEIEVNNLVREFFDEDQTLKIRIFLFRCHIAQGVPRACDCRDFGFFLFKELGDLDLAPADRKIYAYIKESS